jgi:hypothetical protein
LEPPQNYKNKAYWALPENVRHAIDLSKKKSRHSDFYNRMAAVNEKIAVYKMIFYSAAPSYEKQFLENKRKRMEAAMRKEQEELENFINK